MIFTPPGWIKFSQMPMKDDSQPRQRKTNSAECIADAIGRNDEILGAEDIAGGWIRRDADI